MKEAAQRDKKIVQKVCSASMQDRCSFQYRFFHRGYITAVANLPIASHVQFGKKVPVYKVLLLVPVIIES